MKTILCYGDSNTWGYKPDPSVLVPVRYPYHVRWTGVLRSALGDNYVVIDEGLNSRTTVVDDPLNEGRNGKTYLKPSIESHSPLDFVVLMLGSNDFKERFSLSAYEIVYGIETLVQTIRTHSLLVQKNVPTVLVLSPPPVGKVLKEDQPAWLNAQAKSELTAQLLQKSARIYKYDLLNTHSLMTADELDVDGIHLPESCHQKLGLAVAKKITEINK